MRDTEDTIWLARLARSLVEDAAAADDVVQETMLASLRHPDVAARGGRSWRAAVARNAVRQTRRSGARRRVREREAARMEMVEGGDALAIEESRQLVRGAIAALPDHEREIVRLRFEQDLPPRRIAEALGLEDAMVRKRLSRARGRLRDRLEAHFGDRRRAMVALVPLATRTGSRAGMGLATWASIVVVVLGLLAGVGWWLGEDPSPVTSVPETVAVAGHGPTDAPVGPGRSSRTPETRPLGSGSVIKRTASASILVFGPEEPALDAWARSSKLGEVQVLDADRRPQPARILVERLGARPEEGRPEQVLERSEHVAPGDPSFWARADGLDPDRRGSRAVLDLVGDEAWFAASAAPQEGLHLGGHRMLGLEWIRDHAPDDARLIRIPGWPGGILPRPREDSRAEVLCPHPVWCLRSSRAVEADGIAPAVLVATLAGDRLNQVPLRWRTTTRLDDGSELHVALIEDGHEIALAPGRHRITAVDHHGRPQTESRIVALGEGEAARVLLHTRHPTGAHVTGRALVGGVPVTRAAVRMTSEPWAGKASHGVRVFTDSAGRFAIPLGVAGPRSALASRHLTLHAHPEDRPRMLDRRIEVAIPVDARGADHDVGDIELEMEEPRLAVDLFVTDEGGQPLIHQPIDLVVDARTPGRDGADQQLMRVWTDDGGRAAFSTHRHDIVAMDVECRGHVPAHLGILHTSFVESWLDRYLTFAPAELVGEERERFDAWRHFLLFRWLAGDRTRLRFEGDRVSATVVLQRRVPQPFLEIRDRDPRDRRVVHAFAITGSGSGKGTGRSGRLTGGQRRLRPLRCPQVLDVYELTYADDRRRRIERVRWFSTKVDFSAEGRAAMTAHPHLRPQSLPEIDLWELAPRWTEVPIADLTLIGDGVKEAQLQLYIPQAGAEERQSMADSRLLMHLDDPKNEEGTWKTWFPLLPGLEPRLGSWFPRPQTWSLKGLDRSYERPRLGPLTVRPAR